ncbi:MAG: hypothetical protein PHF56_10445 [Desulfuromonadaceae bacterium]|nr:hypothetical protein [Desulfuromonadaceae bacterium]
MIVSNETSLANMIEKSTKLINRTNVFWGTSSIIIVIIVGLLDWFTGYELNFFVFYFIPISICAWFIGLSGGIIMSLFSAIVWFWVDILTQAPHASQYYVVWNTLIRLVAFLSIGYSVFKISILNASEHSLTNNLRQSLMEIKTMEAILPICCQCKKIRDEKGNWHQIESYIRDHTNSEFSHGYCPDCGQKAMEEIKQFRK